MIYWLGLSIAEGVLICSIFVHPHNAPRHDVTAGSALHDVAPSRFASLIADTRPAHGRKVQQYADNAYVPSDRYVCLIINRNQCRMMPPLLY